MGVKRSAGLSCMGKVQHLGQGMCIPQCACLQNSVGVAFGQGMRPNKSFNRSRYGMPPWPCSRFGSSSAAWPRRHASVAQLVLR